MRTPCGRNRPGWCRFSRAPCAFHQTAIDDCPFDFRLDAAVAKARQRVRDGLIVPETDFHEEQMMIAAIGPEAQANRRGFDRAVRKAEERLAGIVGKEEKRRLLASAPLGEAPWDGAI